MSDTPLPSLSGQQVLVLGLGESGLAMARWCARAGARVLVWDSRRSPPQLAALHQHVPDARFDGGELEAAAMQGIQLVLKSPGLAPHDARIAPATTWAEAHGVPIAGEVELFAQALQQL